MRLNSLSRAFILFLVTGTALACNFTSRIAQSTHTVAPTQTPVPTNTPEPTATLAPTATFTPVATLAEPTAAAPTATEIVVASIPITFTVNQVLRFGGSPFKQALSGSVVSGTFDRYELGMLANESLDIQLSSVQQTAGFTLLGPDRKAMRGSENGEARWWSSTVNTAGTYAIIIGSELGRADYNLSVTILPSGASAGGAYKPLPAAECKQMQNQAQDALKVNFSQNEGSFSVGAGVGGTACILSANGNGRDFESVEAVINALQGAFGNWSLDKTLSGDGATGSVRGYRSGDDLMIVSVQWRPAPEANCPAGQPIENCNVKAKQKLYAIAIQVARK